MSPVKKGWEKTWGDACAEYNCPFGPTGEARRMAWARVTPQRTVFSRLMKTGPTPTAF
ncbi:hypothetical protein GCM10008949_23520 [Deinococcus humi]|nr:hypothetical protein GCM10008949_23520 [Deinococcus humi]